MLRQCLERLSKSGKQIFLATNSHIEYTDLIMTATIGQDWQDFFHLILINCKKPVFQATDSVFFSIDGTAKNRKGKVLSSLEEFSDSIASG